MSTFKRYKGRRLKDSKDTDWSKGTWYIWKRINGRIIHKALPEAKTKEQAETAERRIIEMAFNRRYGIPETTGFAEFCDKQYDRYVEQNNVNITAKKYYVKLLKSYFKKRLLSEIGPQDCRDCQWHMQRKMSDSSVNRVMSTLSKIFSLACEEELLDRNPMQYVKMLKEPPPRSRLLTAKEKEWLLRELQKDSLLLRLVTLALNLPLRKGQLLAITPDAVDLQNGRLWIIQSKGREPRIVPLNSIATSTLQSMIQDGQIPFPLKDFRKRWFRAIYGAGIDTPETPVNDRFRFHDLRKEFASELIRQNVNPNLVQKLFAHSDMRITNVYMHSEFDALQVAVNTLDATKVQPTQETEGPPN